MPSGSAILVTGTEPNLGRTLALILRGAGYTAFIGEYDLQASQRLEVRPYDLVILDLNTPDGNGIPLLTRIRQSDPELPVVILAGFTSPESIIGIKRTKTLEYLVKPIDPAYLIDCIQAMLSEPDSPMQ